MITRKNKGILRLEKVPSSPSETEGKPFLLWSHPFLYLLRGNCTFPRLLFWWITAFIHSRPSSPDLIHCASVKPIWLLSGLGQRVLVITHCFSVISFIKSDFSWSLAMCQALCFKPRTLSLKRHYPHPFVAHSLKAGSSWVASWHSP